ncbi:uncharacterized protein CLUP02_12924 [Colletotrichum lupini]|uniref:Uncharacterized protein n=1 Tax=Colletotrichum lupini TaxID=145971 RepID=A0A9Q8T1A0_9PEZI|nr:uncharacterized protein CLUP02_12924 [Colletotrichum lupini]UQC87419.1 hypothetical protein CLUP02_12924 [Colletotrichum lupini]
MKVRSQMVAPSARVRRYRFGDGQKVMRRYLGLLDNAAEPDDIATSAQIRGPPTSTASHEKPPTLSHETVILRELYVANKLHHRNGRATINTAQHRNTNTSETDKSRSTA